MHIGTNKRLAAEGIPVGIGLSRHLCSEDGVWFMRPSGSYSTVVVVNFGGQYAHMISRRLRELGVYTEILHYYEAEPDKIRELGAGAVVLSGGPRSVLEPNSPRIGKWILGLGVPVLGICYGHQLLAMLIGGRIERGPGEYGRTWVRILRRDDPLFRGWGSEEETWMSHGDYVASVPSSAEVLAVSRDTGYIAAFRLRDRPVYGVQFHPEVSHTPKGRLLLDNFVSLVAGLAKNWRPENIIEQLVEEIRARVPPGEKVLVAVSGGVDSTTTALLVKKAVGDRLVAVFVDHGLLREGEANEVLSLLRSLGIDPVHVDASKLFLERLRGVTDCEEKRKIIGRTFIEVFEDIARRDSSIKWLAQGTTYPDVIESGAVPGSDRIKSHHNVGGLPQKLGLRVLEPLRYFYKDEVRRIAMALGVPREYAYRHPFPGPGLAVRVIGEVTEEKLEIARKASRIVEEELRKTGLYYDVWQAFAVVGDDKWVGVKGDQRAEGHIVIVRIVASEDGMTADWARIPYEVLDRISWRITSEVPGVTMVAYSVTTKPPSTIEPC